ncbi:MAG TPA: delta(1)-pyrroline-2-carboxylate reductase family protein [Polaromonas sp.]|uniref:delta(1)-pyrroline-2-carboxylate reductase family protein n=1 Tax=Polaromonas sp. UBA4122 TaxID=1947074 RepID=UPI000ED40AF7|nr:delta(1)-pyrroline-2-carboxylate reductase family protein [Polaromonas sp. UBA4122]HAL40627.1 delta(1)-pyrroline-2-carboxylate reductase family protein [Polaromonas sp.]
MTAASLTPLSSTLLDPAQTAARLPYPLLVKELARLLEDTSVQVPPRLVQPLPGGASLFVMPALDARTAITKLITFTPANAGSGLATIQGDVVVFDVITGQRKLVLDGPTVTARRTAAVSLLAAQRLAPCMQGPLLIVGAGVQGKAHLEAFAEGLPIKEVVIASRSASSAQGLAQHAQSLGLKARVVTDANAALADCPLAVICTPASGVVLSALPRSDAFIAAVGAFTPQMVELSPELCCYFAEQGTVVVDTVDAEHEAGDLLQAGLDVARFASLADVIRAEVFPVTGPVLFKSCGWAGWDLAAARTVLAQPAG